MSEKETVMRGFTPEESHQLLGACDRVWNAIGFDILASDPKASNDTVVEVILDGGCFDDYAELPKELLARFRARDFAATKRWLKKNRRYN